MKRLIPAAIVLLTSSTALATGFTDYGQDIGTSTETRYTLKGSFRLRSEALNNLDLDRGPTPSGQLLFPVPLSDPKAQTLYYTDMRLRTDFAAYAPGGVVAVKGRIDILDNIAFGGSPDGVPGTSTTQKPPATAFRVKRVYGEVLTPLGFISAGRMGHHWGLGMLANSGDCADCDSGDAADRIAYIVPAVGHIFALAYDFSSTGYLVPRKDTARAVDVEPSAATRTVSVAILNWRDDFARKRRRKAGKDTLEYGAYYSQRWQNNDVPATYLPMAQPQVINSAQVMRRGLDIKAVDAWARFTSRYFRLEFEGAYMNATMEQGSLLPGLLMPNKITSKQLGAVLESDVGSPDGIFGAGADFGYASGDAAPGFGARPGIGAVTAPKAGDLDGPQASGKDTQVNNFRFHPDYRIDRILFREIIGTVTDAIYIRPHARFKLADFGSGRLVATVAAVASWANYASSTPGGKKPLGLEVDPTIAYTSDDGFSAALEHAIFFPGSGLDNPDLGMRAKTAQLIRLRLTFAF